MVSPVVLDMLTCVQITADYVLHRQGCTQRRKGKPKGRAKRSHKSAHNAPTKLPAQTGCLRRLEMAVAVPGVLALPLQRAVVEPG